MNALGTLERLGATLTRRRHGDGPLPDPSRPEGSNLIPQIRHIVVVMMENHSYDNYLGTLGHGDGFTLDAGGLPTNANPDASGGEVRAHHLAATTQLPGIPTQSWAASHHQYDGGANDGFVTSLDGLPGDPAIAMGYWTEAELPYYAALARTFVLCDRWYGSCLGPTLPNRRFLISGTAHGLSTDSVLDLFDEPPGGTIFDALSRNGISWVNYHSASKLRLRRGARLGGELRKDLESLTQFTADVYPLGLWRYLWHIRPVAAFLSDAARGRLPAVSIVDPNFEVNSEENPQDITVGAAFAARMINAAMAGPGWGGTVVIWTYDEHGGYYDHVPPPAAPPPDDVPPKGQPGGAYDRLGFRVPAVVAAPFARPGRVSSTVYDHTSVLKLIEKTWNLPPLTRRDAAANDLLDTLDLESPPAFGSAPLPPPLPPARAT